MQTQFERVLLEFFPSMHVTLVTSDQMFVSFEFKLSPIQLSDFEQSPIQLTRVNSESKQLPIQHAESRRSPIQLTQANSESKRSSTQLSESRRLLTQFLLMETSLVSRRPADLRQELQFPFQRSRVNTLFFM